MCEICDSMHRSLWLDTLDTKPKPEVKTCDCGCDDECKKDSCDCVTVNNDITE
jgi:hypothetical protein